MKFLISVCLFVNIAIFHSADGINHEKYKGYKVFRVYPTTQTHLRLIKKAVSENQKELDISRAQTAEDDPLDLLASPRVMEDFIALIQMLQIPVETIVPDLPSALAEHIENSIAEDDSTVQGFRLDKYHDLEQISQWLHNLELEYSDRMEIITIGKSYEGRPIDVVKFSKRTYKAEKKKAIWLDAGIHSNEWAGPATMLYFIHQLAILENIELAELLEHFDWYILPVFNVDGYVYTWTEDRLWRKSRAVYGINGTCIGVDLNRNWYNEAEVHGIGGLDECSGVYHGPTPFSEPETQAVSDFLRANNHSIVSYVAYHSYSQFWMTPYGHSNTLRPDNFQELMSMGNRIVEAIARVHGTKYKVGPVSDLIGIILGSSVDYTYKTLNIKYSFGVELRDSGHFGTLLPADQILPNAEESLAGIIQLGKILRRKLLTGTLG